MALVSLILHKLVQPWCWYKELILCDNCGLSLHICAVPNVWVAGWMGSVNMLNKLAKSGNQLLWV